MRAGAFSLRKQGLWPIPTALTAASQKQLAVLVTVFGKKRQKQKKNRKNPAGTRVNPIANLHNFDIMGLSRAKGGIFVREARGKEFS